MIWYWLEQLGAWVVLLFGKPPSAEQRLMLNKKINVNLKCPSCGHSKGELRCTEQLLRNNQHKILVQHRCLVCKARFFEAPVAQVDPTMVMHGVPTSEVEKEEDKLMSRGHLIDAVTGRGIQ